ncbi:MAG: hypothetical protein F4092_11545 [Rhodospirillaceae bacterium]|nr:hypothetical protein [Rhodospirillaceae bacterium]MYJ72377.1 hypothetical protein [Rhodospirillaceae bacterium]
MPGSSAAKARANARLRRRYAERVAVGICTKCGKTPPDDGLKVCGRCAERRRDADRTRRARAKDRGKPYAGRDPVRCRRAGRAADRRRRQARRDAGLCTKCGRNPTDDGRSVCETCREAMRARERRRYAARIAAGLCVRCSEPAAGGLSRCARHAALEAERVEPERKSATSRKRYARRRAERRCVDCGIETAGAARCPACAYRSNSRAPDRYAAQAGPPFYTVIELETGVEHGTYETEAETAACLVFLGLRLDQVEIRSNMPLLALALAGVP